MTPSNYPRTGSDTRTPSLLPRDLSRCSSQEARKLLPFESASALCCLPLGFLEQYGTKTMTVAVGEDSPELRKQLQFLVGLEVRTVTVDSAVLKEAIFLTYRGAHELIDTASSKIVEITDRIDRSARVGLRDCATPENELLCSLIDYALAHDASDLHFIPSAEGLFVSIRVSGELRTRDTKLCSPEIYIRMVQRIKVLSRLDITSKTVVQEGSFAIPLLHGTVSARVSILPTVHGESLSLRFLKRSNVKTLDELGFSKELVTTLKEVAMLKHGLVLFAGATGSGKTTSLYALSEYLSHRSCRITSIEDPVECIVPWMVQTQVVRERGLTYETGLKALLRQDPDVILIGEIRDAPVGRIALEAALTGHRVLSSIHAGSIQEVKERFKSFGIESSLLAHAMQLIIHQELSPKRCSCFSPSISSCAICDGTGITGVTVNAESEHLDSAR